MPVIFFFPARLRHGAHDLIFLGPYWHTTWRDKADIAFYIAIDHILLRRVKGAHGGEEIQPIVSLGHFHAGLCGQIVIPQGGPGQGQNIALGQGGGGTAVGVAQHRTMAGAPHLHDHVRGILDLDDFVVDFEGGRAIRRQITVRIGGVEFLEIQILDIRPGIGKAPGDAVIAAQYDARYAG